MTINISVGGDPASLSLEYYLNSGLQTFEDRFRDGRLYASQAWCSKEQVLSSQNILGSNHSASGAMYMAIGRTIEEQILSAFDSKQILFFSDYRIPEFLNVGGKIDGIIYINGKVRALEIKSCGQLPSKPNPHHTAQAATYAAVTGIPSKILYFSRSVADFGGKLKMREFDIAFEDGVEAVRSLAISFYSNEAKVTPHIPSKILMGEKKGGCDNCGFKNVCWGTDKIAGMAPEATNEEMLAIIEKADTFTAEFMTPEVIIQRRNGVLKHIRTFGTPAATNILSQQRFENLI